MAIYPLEASVRHLSGVAIIDLAGEIDGVAENVLETAYTTAEERDPIAILLNFERVTYINSKGIALIVLLLARVQKSNRRLLACGLTDHFREIFQITRLSDYIGLCVNEQTALDRISAQEAIPETSSESDQMETL